MDFPTLDEIKDVGQVMSNWSAETLATYRRMLLVDINGRHFKALYFWPRHMVQSFWMKPMTGRDTFKVMCFLLGNGCHVRLAMYWVLSSISWVSKNQLEGRHERLHQFFIDFTVKRNTWYFYNLEQRMLLHLDGSRHNVYTL